MKFLAITALTAGLFAGSAAVAQGVMQPTATSYALTLIDAGNDGSGNSKTGGPVTANTDHVRVKVTVSVPRAEGSSNYGGISAAANPVRLMYRKHKGFSTAFDGSISLTRDAPYADAAGTPLKTAYYPMPQMDAAGLPIRDPMQLNYFAVPNGSAVNAAGVDYDDEAQGYIAFGQAHDPARWEATYLSPVYAVDGLAATNPMVYSLLCGQGTYEWYAASFYGIGFTRISPIQDIGRAMSFTDIRLWQPISGADDNLVDTGSKMTLGQNFEWRVRAMPEAKEGLHGWHIYRGSIGANYSGVAGAQLLNLTGADTAEYSDYARIESPLYPDGVGSITFEAMVSSTDVDAAQELLVQRCINDKWEDVETLVLKDSFSAYTVDFKGTALASARFRLIRKSQLTTAGDANLSTMIIRNLLVRSAAPRAAFGEPGFSPDCPSYYTYDATGTMTNTPFRVLFKAAGDANAVPRGYAATLNLRRRAEGDTTRDWMTAPVTVEKFEERDGGATLAAAFTHEPLQVNPDGSVNAAEGAFFLNPAGEVVGLMPGVYDLALNYHIYGSFKAGRSIIDEHESVDGTASSYGVTVTGDDGAQTTEYRPNVLDLREQQTAHKGVYLRVMYRSGTRESSAPYTLEYLDVPLLPSAREPNLWRVDLSRKLRLEDETAEYAWGFDPKSVNPASTDAPTFVTERLAFTVYAVLPGDGGTVWYGQNTSVASGVIPPMTRVVPALTETMVVAKTEADAVPMVLDIASLTTSHVMVELSLPDDPLAGGDAFARLAGSYWQDFNTWYAPSENFTETDFRENVRSRVADFDCTVEEDDGEYFVTEGWIPDEGPLADTTAFTDTFEVGREGIDNYAFYLKNLTSQSGNYFASWGASSTRAAPSYLYYDSDVNRFESSYLKLNTNAEVVLNRTWHKQSTEYLPDAQLRLRGQGTGIEPLAAGRGGVMLKGVGKVSFTLGLSIPYDIDHRVRILAAEQEGVETDLYALHGYGVAAGVQFNRPSETCASSGFSVSYFLEDTYYGTKFELRLTQIVDFGTSNDKQPSESVIAELYKWGGSSPERLPLTVNNKTVYYHTVASSLNGNAYGLWVTPEGKLAVSVQAGSTTPTALTSPAIFSANAVASTSANRKYAIAFGSADCRPIFRQVTRLKAPSNGFTGSVVSAISPAEAYIQEPSPPKWAGNGSSWSLTQDATSSSRIQISRRTPPAELAGRVIIRALPNTAGVVAVDPKTVSTDKTGTTFSVTMGAANSTLLIEPDGEECNVFIDNLSVSSWCGNDANRNGDHVPGYTDAGFYAVNGFAGVGVWIRPDSPDQLTASPAEYRGNQCLLMQRSRQNTDGLPGEITTDGVKHTGASLALYGPYSDTGFGPVSFRYCIPSQDEYAGSGSLPSVRVMLQYNSSTSYYNNYLAGNVPLGWVNVSDPVELKNTSGEWLTASITPKRGKEELVAAKGTLRLVMVTTGLEADDDPYVYIDDFTVTDNAEGSLASWSARNVKLTDTPVSQLYWKDRAATASADPEEETFAEKSSLTRALQFNDVLEGHDTDGRYDTCVLNSPLLENGVGRISFAARLAEENPEPVRLYILASESEADADAAVYKPVTYVEVTNTVYTVYDVDLSKFKYYYTKPTADLLPGESNTTDAFASTDVRRLRLRAYLEGDGATTDHFGTSAENRQPNPGRILLDTLAVSDPVMPSLRVESVAFSNVAGSNSAKEFVRNSPLSQPISNAPMLRAMVSLGHMQLLKDETIRVFLTMKPHDITNPDASVKRYTAGYAYTDVMGNTVSASDERPLYGWDPAALESWPLSKWFNLNDDLYTPTGGVESLADIQALYPCTVELSRQDGTNLFFGDLSKLGLKELPANSLVQYTAWAVYQSEETDQWFAAQITPTTHTDFPWYFPRSLNAELQAKAAEEALIPEGEPFFSPYYWVYSCLPGEAFINELDLRDQLNAAHAPASFTEICAPAGLDVGEWKLAFTGRNGTAYSEDMSWVIPSQTALLKADPGAVPEMRKTDSSANRAFYTVLTNTSPVYTREGGAAKGSPVTDLGAVANTPNGGAASRGWGAENLGANMAASVQLLRPTGGAEHILVFSNAIQSVIAAEPASTYQQQIDTLYNTYLTAYSAKGFGSEWYQTFLEGSWESYITGRADAFGEIALQEPGLTQVKAHSRRLTKANYFPSDGVEKDYRFNQKATTFEPVQDYANGAYANSIATIDMGGMWVTRRNAIDTDVAGGPLDLTELCYGTWPKGQNPTVTPRAAETVPDGVDIGAGAVSPYTQVTPRQINPDQYLIKYSGLAQSVVVSEIEGLGSHELGLYDTAGAEITETRRAGRTSPNTWSLDLTVPQVQLTYKALPFQQLTGVQLRLVDSKTSDPLRDETKIRAQISDCEVVSQPDTETEGWVTIVIPADMKKTFTLTAKLIKVGSALAEDRYNVEVRAAFETVKDGAKDVITKVSPYCGGTLGGSALRQPWWGSGFGFAVEYKDENADGAMLSGVIVTYPSPIGLSLQGNQWLGLQSPWAGLTLTYTPDYEGTAAPQTVTLIGKEYDEAIELLKTVFGPKGHTRFVEIKNAVDGLAADTSLIGILSDSYAREMGYKAEDSTTWKQKEPAIPFCVWGVYTYTVQGATDTEKVVFLMPQAAPGEQAGVFETPSWYTPAPDPNADKADTAAEYTAPYFYLYSTPPQAAWLNEINLTKGPSGSAPYAEVVMPRLRDGILNATPEVPQTTNTGWALRRYTAAGAPVDGPSLDVAPQVASNSSSYTYNTVELGTTFAVNETSAYVLIRPCGAAEGGVWTGADATGAVAVPAPAALKENDWLLKPEAYVVPGVTDATDVDGSVQLVGKTVHDGKFPRLSSAVADRTEWTFSAETQNTANGDDRISPDTKPEWNQVTVTSSLRNTVYGGVFCGYQAIPGYFEDDAVSGTASTEGPITLTLGGSDWVYDSAAGKTMALSYRPRTNYRFESISLPPELIGQVMLIGRDAALPAATVATEVARLLELAKTKADAPMTDWLQLGTRDINGIYRAEVDYSTYTDGTGATVREPTGLIRFNPDYVVSAPTADEVVTFGDQSSYALTLVFIREPASAQNRIEVSMGQGDVQLGAWLATQTFWAWGTDAKGDPIPDPDKGGDTVSKPIWSDEDGNADGDYANVHGWVHQPVTGDRLGMSAVINPELGLAGGLIGASVEHVRDALEAKDASLRPFLVWTLIPKNKVPENLFDRTRPEGEGSLMTFLQNWALPNWIGGSPAVGDRTTVPLRTLRKDLKVAAELDSGFYSAAGIIPMACRGYCGTDADGKVVLGTPDDPVPRAENTLLAFSTMSEDELDTALKTAVTGLSNDEQDLLPYTAAIDMSDASLWQDGAILRFAVVIADARTGLVYDCQALANFSSNELAAYCPWYVPDVTSNVNRATAADDAGISPFAWVYAIEQGGVWLNEIRPFATQLSSGSLMPSAVELAMKASPLEARTDGLHVPTLTLDGWKLEMKYAPMPKLGTSPETPINWITHRTIDLVSWVPYRRISPNYDTTAAGANPKYYDLDFYYATTVLPTTSSSSGIQSSLLDYAYAPDKLNTFKWLQISDELFDPGLEAELRASADAYKEGIIYAVALVRNNGVVVDEVLFYNSVEGMRKDEIQSRVLLAIDCEKSANTVAGVVRGVSHVALPLDEQRAAASAQFAERLDTGDLQWVLDHTSTATSTFPGANYWPSSAHTQPYAGYDPSLTTYSLLTARILGSDAILRLARAGGAGLDSGPSVSASYVNGTAYTLTLSDWNRDWFTLESVQKNGTPLATPVTAGTVYSVDSAGLLSASESLTVDTGTLTEDTDYAITFIYTPAASQLVAAGALAAEDDGFLEWLLKVAPEAILEQSAADGVTAAEKYWLGLDSAAIDASDVNLAITAIGTHTEPEETLPSIRVSLKQGDTEISELTGDGVLVLLGKETMDEPWQYVRRLYPEDINGETHLILRTPCSIFKAILLSESQAEEYK